MKLRINKQSIRLRLSQSDLQNFKEKKIISEILDFPGSDSMPFTYTLRVSQETLIAASYLNNSLIVSVPEHIGMGWANSDEVGFQFTTEFDNGNQLFILVEKDFQCLTPRPMEDESDNFPNPNQLC